MSVRHGQPSIIELHLEHHELYAHQIYEYIPHNDARSAPAAVGGGVLGGIVGSILSGGQ